MAISINTNSSALNALQNLNLTTRSLEETQLRINTGLEVKSAKDNAAVFAIAQNLRADKQGLEAVKDSLNRASSVLDISMAAAESIQDVLIQMKEKVVAAADEGLDEDSRAALAEDFNRLREQIGIIAKNATFNGTNMIDGPASPPAKPATLIALVSPDAVNKIEVDRQDLQLKANGTTVFAATDIVQLAGDTSFTTATEANALITNIDTSIRNVSQSLTVMGAGSKSMELQSTFVNKLGDTLETGIGNLVDADMARESARLQALQVKQQLGVQALSIANSQPKSILSLFGNG
ncbi:flagellin [Parapedomonas caeni]